jgi:hypothetical protein
LSKVRQAHEHLLEQGAAPVGVREVVADSWLRSVAAGVDVDASEPPITMERELLTDYRAQHPLAKVFPDRRRGAFPTASSSPATPTSSWAS